MFGAADGRFIHLDMETVQSGEGGNRPPSGDINIAGDYLQDGESPGGLQAVYLLVQGADTLDDAG